MRTTRLTLAALALSTLLMTGCQPDSPSPNDGVVVLPLRTFALNVDPATLADVDSRKVATLIHAGLVAVDQEGNIEPRVASSWRRTGPKEWEFQIRRGLTFSNGRPATPEAVVRSLCASLQPQSTQAWSLESIEHETSADGKSVTCSGLSASGDRVLIRESGPSPWLFEGLAGPGGWVIDVDAPAGAYGVRPGVGPYAISSIQQDRQIVLKPRPGGPLQPGATSVLFRYLPDNAVAAAAFNQGALDLLEIESPDLKALVTEGDRLKTKGAQLLRSNTDRVRIVAINLRRLEETGFTPSEAYAFRIAYGQAMPREAIKRISNGLTTPLLTAFPPAESPTGNSAPAPSPPQQSRQLRLISENDAWSDRIAASLPSRVGGATIRYTTLEKSLFLQNLFKGEYDLALLKLEATHHSPRFWAAFFTPGNPYAVIGKPLDGLANLDLATPQGIRGVATRVDAEGNWVPIVRDVGMIAISGRLRGVRLTGTGQLSLEQVSLK